MQANEDVARKLSELTVQAREQRAQIQEEIQQIRCRPASAARSIGMDALKTARTLGLTDPKVALPLAKTIFIPAALAVGRLLLKNASPRRFLGAALIAASSYGIYKGIEYDEEHPRPCRLRNKGRTPASASAPSETGVAPGAKIPSGQVSRK